VLAPFLDARDMLRFCGRACPGNSAELVVTLYRKAFAFDHSRAWCTFFLSARGRGLQNPQEDALCGSGCWPEVPVVTCSPFFANQGLSTRWRNVNIPIRRPYIGSITLSVNSELLTKNQ